MLERSYPGGVEYTVTMTDFWDGKQSWGVRDDTFEKVSSREPLRVFLLSAVHPCEHLCSGWISGQLRERSVEVLSLDDDPPFVRRLGSVVSLGVRSLLMIEEEGHGIRSFV